MKAKTESLAQLQKRIFRMGSELCSMHHRLADLEQQSLGGSDRHLVRLRKAKADMAELALAEMRKRLRK